MSQYYYHSIGYYKVYVDMLLQPGNLVVSFVSELTQLGHRRGSRVGQSYDL